MGFIENPIRSTFDYDKYRYYTNGNKVVAVSTYAGKTVRGTAKCDPNDAFDLEKGKKLAAARCAVKVAAKREKRASQKCSEASAAYLRARNFDEDMTDYYHDAIVARKQAEKNLQDILRSL